ncbi:hypothetical protein ZWY2020_040011 [Hordeum vulgare]|nr:hypothetical protein ZWY2020_040011 [Hordeum vulgare]
MQLEFLASLPSLVTPSKPAVTIEQNCSAISLKVPLIYMENGDWGMSWDDHQTATPHRPIIDTDPVQARQSTSAIMGDRIIRDNQIADMATEFHGARASSNADLSAPPGFSFPAYINEPHTINASMALTSNQLIDPVLKEKTIGPGKEVEYLGPEGDGASPNAIEKALRRTTFCNLDLGPPLAPHLASSIDDDSSAFSALEGVPLGHLAKISANSAIVFQGKKGSALEQLADIQAKEILDGCLMAARARATAEADKPTMPRPLARGEVGPLAPQEIRRRTLSHTMLLRRTLSAYSSSGSRVDPLED